MLGEVCGVAPLLALEGVRVVRVRRGARLRRDARGAEEDEAREAHVVDDDASDAAGTSRRDGFAGARARASGDNREAQMVTRTESLFFTLTT